MRQSSAPQPMRIVTVLLSMATAIGFLALPVPAQAAGGAATGSNPTIVFAPSASGVLKPGDPLILNGSISNPSDSDLAAGTATAYLDRNAAASRSDLDSWLGTTAAPAAADGLGTRLISVPTPAVPAGRTANISIIVQPSDVGLSADSEWGTHGIAVVVTVAGNSIGQSRSDIVWYPDGTVIPTALAVAMPLTVPATNVGLIPADTLAAYTAPDGLLTRELDRVINRPVAIGVDPMIIASIRILGPSAPPSATDWLDRLQAAQNETFPLSYADSDLAAAAQAGAKRLLTPTSFPIDSKLFPGYTPAPTGSATATATPGPTTTPAPTLPNTQTLTQFPYTAALSGLAWPSDDSVVESDLDAFTTIGFRSAILSSTNVSYGDLDYTPSAPAKLGDHPVIVSDSQLSALLRAAAAAPDELTWEKDMANLSAAIAIVTRQRGEVRSLLATVGRGSPGGNDRLGETLQALAALPWANSATLAGDLAPSAGAATVTVTAKPEPAGRIDTVRRLLASEAAVGNFSSILADPAVITGERRLSLLAVLGNSWRQQLPAWNTATQKYLTASDKLVGSVRIADIGSLFVPAQAVRLGISVTNKLDWPVTVYVTLASPSGMIKVEDQRVELTVEANSQAKAAIPVRALANGRVAVRASLSSATNVPIGSTASLKVDVQAGWESVFTAIAAIAVALVFGFGIYRNIAKRRRANSDLRPGPDDAPPPGDPSP